MRFRSSVQLSQPQQHRFGLGKEEQTQRGSQWDGDHLQFRGTQRGNQWDGDHLQFPGTQIAVVVRSRVRFHFYVQLWQLHPHFAEVGS